MLLHLPQITLLGIDCINPLRLQEAFNICERDIVFGSSKLLTSLKIKDKRVIKIPKINSLDEYSLFIIKNLAKYIDTKYVLLIQYDGFILNPSSWTNKF